MFDIEPSWCGDMGTGWWASGFVPPCTMESIAAATLLLAAIVSALAGSYVIRLRESLSTAICGKSGMTGAEAGYIGAALTLAFLHLAHALGAAATGLPIVHIAYQASGFIAWVAVASITARASRSHAVPRFTLQLLTTLAVYAWGLYTYILLYLRPAASPLPFPDEYLRAQLWTQLLQLVLAGLLTYLEWHKPPSIAAAPAGYAALADVEAPAQQPSGHTWVSLFFEACKFVWPQTLGLRLRLLACVLLLLSMRVLNLAVPILYKRLIDRLGEAAAAAAAGLPLGLWQVLSPWTIMYLGAVFFQGGGGGGIVGLVNNLRAWLWVPVGQDSYRRISLRLLEHLLDLDLAFHLKRKTGEVTKVVDRGTAAMQNVLSTVVFNIAPQIFDVFAASFYLASALEPWIALVVFITVGSYIPLTIAVTEWRGGFRREMNRTENIKSARATDALLNYETVKLFTNEEHELKHFGVAIDDYQKAEYRFTVSLNVLNVVQSAIMFAGIASGLIVCTAGVAGGRLTVGDTVLFLTLMAQLYAPLNFFGTYYRIIQQYMIDMENLFELLDRQPGVQEAVQGAKPLALANGEVEYRNVCFGYEPGNPVLHGVSFTARGGSTIAFVGATGSGKSTLTRLLLRFYDPQGGAVLVDGQDVRGLALASLRAAVGVVPQDTVLFNDTIMHNIRYGRLSATDAEVHEAAEAAAIHKAITERFPKGYDTVVGERGLRLSGGEKQRVAFARALLKNPSILVLDEATSALDTITERQLQGALRSRRQNRTTLIVAHRLSTIADADQIVVLANGVVVEVGSHGELLAAGGLYQQLWTKQSQMGGEEEEEEVGGKENGGVAAADSTASSSVGHRHGHA